MHLFKTTDHPPKRMVDYINGPDPSSLHPLWKHWLVYARDTAPTDKDIRMWEMDQARLRKRLKEIDAASNKMRSEEAAERERGEPSMQSAIARIASQLSQNQYQPPAAAEPQKTQFTNFDIPDQPTGPEPGSNLAFEDGIQIIPKDTKPYSPAPSRLQEILNKKAAEEASSHDPRAESSDSHSTWKPGSQNSSSRTDDL